MVPDMHRYDPEMDELAAAVFAFARQRARADLAPGGVQLGKPQSPEALDAAAGATVTPAGIGGREALRIFTDVLEPACLSVDYPRYLAFVPAAPSEVSILADLVVSACSIYAGSWLEGGGAVWAENQALRWLAVLAGLPASAGGVFVAGGTNGNLSALVAARNAAAAELAATGGARPARWAIVTSAGAHSSVATAADVMDADLVEIPGDRLTGESLRTALAGLDPAGIAAVVATAGTTNLGLVDDLAGVAAACQQHDLWLHVDGDYGGAALAAPSARRRFDGIEHADSLVVDPHKWLFAPFDVCALLYRNPVLGRAAHVQHAAYLDVLYGDAWNPSDYAVHLTRRARGVPFWFSLAAHGTDAYAAAVERCLSVAHEGAALVRAASHLELVAEPELSVVAFRRTGWSGEDYVAWSDRMLQAGEAFVVPSSHGGEPMLRLCVVNPRTTVEDIGAIVDSLAADTVGA